MCLDYVEVSSMLLAWRPSARYAAIERSGFITQAPEEMNGFFAMMTVPPGPPFPEALHLRKMCGIVWCYQGSMEQANTILESIRSYRPPAFEFFVAMPFPMLQGMFDPLYPAGLQWYWKADL